MIDHNRRLDSLSRPRNAGAEKRFCQTILPCLELICTEQPPAGATLVLCEDFLLLEREIN